MNIVLATYNYYPYAWGGSEIYVHGLAKYLQKLGHTVCVIAAVLPSQIDLTKVIETKHFQAFDYCYDNVNVLGVAIKNETTNEIYSRFNKNWQADWQEIITKSSYFSSPIDLLHYNGYTSIISVAIAQVLKEKYACKVITSYHTPISCPNGKLLQYNRKACEITPNPTICSACVIQKQKNVPVWAANTLARFLPTQSTIGVLPKKIVQNIPTSLQIKKLVTDTLYSFDFLNQYTDKWVVMSEQIKATIIRQGVKNEKIQLLRHGIDNFFLTNTNSKEVTKQEGLFVYAGRFEKIKGFITLLTAWLQLPEEPNKRQLQIIGAMQGEDSQIESIISQAKKRSDIHFLGKKTPQEMKIIVSNAHCMIIPSECVEIGPLVFHEAIACQTNVLVSDIGGTKELAQYYGGGCQTFQMGNFIDLKEKILHFRYQSIHHKVCSQEEHYNLLLKIYHC
jgi:glycosyltransferase involved in cell wall biosynthesis